MIKYVMIKYNKKWIWDISSEVCKVFIMGLDHTLYSTSHLHGSQLVMTH